MPSCVDLGGIIFVVLVVDPSSPYYPQSVYCTLSVPLERTWKFLFEVLVEFVSESIGPDECTSFGVA